MFGINKLEMHESFNTALILLMAVELFDNCVYCAFFSNVFIVRFVVFIVHVFIVRFFRLILVFIFLSFQEYFL